MAENIFQKQIVPLKPRILQEERVFVYVPKASTESEGIASFNGRDFGISDGEVSLLWPMQMEIETLTDPTVRPSRIKVMDDEFVNTGKTMALRNPVTGVVYNTNNAEVALNRENRNAFDRPDFVMLDQDKDFDAILGPNQYVKYILKRNNPLEQPSLVQLSNQDFAYSGGIVSAKYPLAYLKEDRNNGFGLMKLGDSGYLLYEEDGTTDVDVDKLYKALEFASNARPTYGGTKANGFTDIDDYIDTATGLAKRTADGAVVVAITAASVGLSKVQNKAFSEYVYADFGTSMQGTFTQKFNDKLDKTLWDEKFSDWNPPSPTKDTPQKWFQSLEAEDESLWDTLRTIRLFLGYFDNLNALTALYPANNVTYGSTAYLLNSRSYWAVRTMNVNQMFDTDAEAKAYTPPKDDNGDWVFDIYLTGSRATDNRFIWTSTTKTYKPYGTPGDALYVDYFLGTDEELQPFINEHQGDLKVGDRIGIRETNQIYIWDGTSANLSTDVVYYEWYDTCVTNMSFMDFVEKQASAFKPDGIASAGSSGLWAQSDHVHPTDLTRLAAADYKATDVTISSQFDNNVDTDFKFNLWEQDSSGTYLPHRTVNVPYVRKGQLLHNWQGQTEFVDNVDSSVHYWSGTAVEFEAEAQSIPDNSIIMVDDNENFTTESFLSKEDLDEQGITIDPANPVEKFVIVSGITDSLIGPPLTLSKSQSIGGKDRYTLKEISLSSTNGKMVVTNNNSLGIKSLPQYQVVVTDINGNPNTNGFRAYNSVKTQTNDVLNDVKLPNNRLIKTKSTGDNIVEIIELGTTPNKPIVTDGLGMIKTATLGTEGLPLVIGPNDTFTQANFLADNTLVSKVSTTEVVILPAGEVLISGNGNEVTTFDTGNILNRVITSDGAGGLRVSTFDFNKLFYSNGSGQLATFPMTTGDVGKFVGVGAGGIPQLLSAPATPTTLPVTTFTTNPGANPNGTVIAILASNPGTLNDGVLYLW